MPKNILLIDMIRHWLNLDKTYQHKKDQAQYKIFQVIWSFQWHLQKSKTFLPKRSHLKFTQQLILYPHADTSFWIASWETPCYHERECFMHSSKKDLQTHSSELGRKTLSKHSLDMDNRFICSSKASFDKTMSFSFGSGNLENKVHLALLISVFLWSLPKYGS